MRILDALIMSLGLTAEEAACTRKLHSDHGNQRCLAHFPAIPTVGKNQQGGACTAAGAYGLEVGISRDAFSYPTEFSKFNLFMTTLVHLPFSSRTLPGALNLRTEK